MAYVRERRLAVAAELLRRTSEEVWKISELVGFASPQVFTRNFKGLSGESPGVYRRGQLGPLHLGGTMASMETPESVSRELRQALAGKLGSSFEEKLIQRLERQYGSSGGAGGRGCEVCCLAGGLRQASRAAFDIAEETKELSEILHQLGAKIGRRNRRLGVRLAELALVTIEDNSSSCNCLHAIYGKGLDSAQRVFSEQVAGDRPDYQAHQRHL